MQENDIKKIINLMQETQGDKDEVQKAIDKNLNTMSESQKEKLNDILKDPGKIKKLMDSPIVQSILSKFKDS